MRESESTDKGGLQVVASARVKSLRAGIKSITDRQEQAVHSRT